MHKEFVLVYRTPHGPCPIVSINDKRSKLSHSETVYPRHRVTRARCVLNYDATAYNERTVRHCPQYRCHVSCERKSQTALTPHPPIAAAGRSREIRSQFLRADDTTGCICTR